MADDRLHRLLKRQLRKAVTDACETVGDRLFAAGGLPEDDTEGCSIAELEVGKQSPVWRAGRGAQREPGQVHQLVYSTGRKDVRQQESVCRESNLGHY